MKKIRRIAIAAVLAIVIVGLAAPFVDAEGYRTRIQTALERALNRKVKVGKVRFNLFTGPGFTVEKVEIADDPSVGIEPLAYVESLEARVTLRTLWTRELAFSNLKLHDPTLNLMKTASGLWNFQLLRGVAGEFPAIQVRNGRINFKFEDTKSVFYLSESDMDVSPLDQERLDVRFSGQPSRTDQAAQSFGRLLARGVWKRAGGSEPELEVNAELERSAISELVKLIEGRGIGLHGVVGSRARIAGPISKLAVTGQLKLEDVHRWDLLPKGGAWQLNYRGLLDLRNQRLELATSDRENTGLPLRLRFRASELLSNPHWAASADLHDMPAAAFVETARHMGAALPDGIAVEGKLSGAVGFSRPGGLQGQLAAKDATLQTPGAPAIKFQAADVVLNGSRVDVGPSTVEAANGQTAELTGAYDLDEQTLDVKITTAGMSPGEFQKGTGVSVPLLGGIEQGAWKGWLRYKGNRGEEGAWSGEFDVHDVRADVPGLAEPVRLAAGSVAMSSAKVTITRMRGRAGDIKFSGEYRHDGEKADRLKLDIAEADVAEIERVLMPALRRRQGLLARFRLRNPPAPEWLRARKLEGTVRIGRLTAGDQIWSFESRLDWNGTEVHLPSVAARREDAEFAGQIAIDLAGPNPQYRLSGRASGVEYKGGTLTLEGSAGTRGAGADMLANAHARGTFEGEDVAFSPEMEFHTISGNFEWTAPGKLRLRNLQAGQGFENYTGQGATQADGRLLLELTSGRRQVKVAGTMSVH